MICIFLISIAAGCSQQPTEIVEETPEKNYYTCGDMQLFLEKTDEMWELYNFTLKTKDNEYTGNGWTFSSSELNGEYLYERKDLVFDDIKVYRCVNRIMLAKTDGNPFKKGFENAIVNECEEVFKEENKKENVYIRTYYNHHQNPSDDSVFITVTVFSYDEKVAKDTFNDIVSELKKIALSFKDEYSVYIPDDLPILSEEKIEDNFEYTNNMIYVTLNEEDMTFTYEGLFG